MNDSLHSIRVFGQTGRMPDKQIDRGELISWLILLGAPPEISEKAKKSLAKYTNLSKADGLTEVWGEKFAAVKKFIGVFIADYEKRTGITLPALKKSGAKFSGMRAHFGEITAYAYGAMSWEDFKLYSESRRHNGKMWEEGRKDERECVDVPTSEDPILLSSFPPEFTNALLDFMSRGFLLI